MTRTFTCPEGRLAAEIEFAIAYTAACNPDRRHELLLSPPGGCRDMLADQVAAMLAERAEKGLSGMTMEDGAEVEAPEPADRA